MPWTRAIFKARWFHLRFVVNFTYFFFCFPFIMECEELFCCCPFISDSIVYNVTVKKHEMRQRERNKDSISRSRPLIAGWFSSCSSPKSTRRSCWPASSFLCKSPTQSYYSVLFVSLIRFIRKTCCWLQGGTRITLLAVPTGAAR